MELTITTDLKSIPAEIDFNFEEIKSELADNLTYYNNLVIADESGIKAAKSDKAKLNKLAEAIDSKRKEIKSVCLAPYSEFETKCKELVTMIKEPVNAIDKQLKEFDEIRKREKYEELTEYFTSEVGELSELVTLDKIINPKWGNVGLKTDALKIEIGDTLDRIKTDLNTINQQYSNVPYKAAIISEYCKEYNLSKTLVYAATLDYQAKMQEKALQKAEPEPTTNAETATPTAPKMETVEPLITGAFEVTCTRSQLIALRDFMRSNAIKFYAIKK